jgi:hypothetical protein
MGHVHLGVLPKTRLWNDVVEALTAGAADEVVVGASARAAERDLLSATDNAVFVEAVRLLLAIPYAARTDDFGDALRALDLAIGDRPEVLELAIAVDKRLEAVRRTVGGSNDLGEIAARALVATLSEMIGDQLPGLFEATPGDVQAATRNLSWSRGISELSRAFYARLVSQSLSYWLDRTLALHVGPEGRFANATARGAFDVALSQHSQEATRIIKEFSGGWYGKTLHDRGGISSRDAAAFGAVALKKIVEELRVRRGRHD